MTTEIEKEFKYVTEPKATLLQHGNLKVVDIAIGTCWDKQRPEDVIDYVRMDRVANKFKHASTIEHVSYTFKLECTRAVLQEVARTRIASPSVKSSRYTLGELEREKPFITMLESNMKLDSTDLLEFAGIVITKEQYNRAKRYLHLVGDKRTDTTSIVELDLLRKNVSTGRGNDVTKYNLPESYKTELIFTINARSLQNVLNLRTANSTLLEYRKLANAMFEQLPEDHKFLFNEMVHRGYDELETFKDVKGFRDYLYSVVNEPKDVFSNYNEYLFDVMATYILSLPNLDNVVTELEDKFTKPQLEIFTTEVRRWIQQETVN